MQDVRALFMKQTVEDDLFDFFAEKHISNAEKRTRVERVIQLCGLETLRARHPYDLSGGEMQRAALAKVLLAEPQLLLLDEPTKGLDAAFKAQLAVILAKLRQDGVAIVMVTHDLDFCAAHADRCALVFDGAVASEGMPRAFFADKRFYTTAANRMARGICDGAVTVADILAMLGSVPSAPPSKPSPPPTAKPSPKSPPPASADKPQVKMPHRASARMFAALAVFLLLIPLTVFFGLQVLGDRKYMTVSLLALLEGILPFFLLLEARRPQARELVTLGVLCALGVAGRIAFAPLPQVKPIAAVVILSGVALGGEAGFLVGAVTALVSNFYFGQGPWTPYQMFALGLLGFFAGLLFCGAEAAAARAALPLRLFVRFACLRRYHEPRRHADGAVRADASYVCGCLCGRASDGSRARTVHGGVPVLRRPPDACAAGQGERKIRLCLWLTEGVWKVCIVILQTAIPAHCCGTAPCCIRAASAACNRCLP